MASRLVINAPFADTMDIVRVGIKGTLLAPRADTVFPTGEIDGQLIVRSFEGRGQINHPMFAAGADPSLLAMVNAANVVSMGITESFLADGSASGADTGLLPSQFEDDAEASLRSLAQCAAAAQSISGLPSGSRRLRQEAAEAGGHEGWRQRMLQEGVELPPLPEGGAGLPEGYESYEEYLLEIAGEGGVPAETASLLRLMAESGPEAVLGRFGSPSLPDCGLHGSIVDGQCVCTDPTWRRGPRCEHLCRDYCHGRGMCNAQDSTKCDCFDPLRWTGDRCEESVCGENAYVEGTRQDGSVICKCAAGWGGSDGQSCDVRVPCVFGTVVGEMCSCMPGWSGADCSTPFPEPIRCFHGEATTTTVLVDPENDGVLTEVESFECACEEGWTGDDCGTYVGRGSDACYFGVQVTGEDNEVACECDPFWAGERCDQFTCVHGLPSSVLQRTSDGKSMAWRPEPFLPGTGQNPGAVLASQAEMGALPEAVSGFVNEWLAGSADVSEGAVAAAGPGGDGSGSTATGQVAATDRAAFAEALQCRCVHGWGGPDCSTHCRAACNWHGTICADDVSQTAESAGASSLVQSTSGEAQCACDDGYEGATCSDVVVPDPEGLDAAGDEDLLSVTREATYGATPEQQEELAGPAAAGGAARALLLVRRAQSSADPFRVQVTRPAAGWRASGVRVSAGQSGMASSACASASAARVASGKPETSGSADEVVDCLPVAVTVGSRTSGRTSSVSVRLPTTMAARLNSSYEYAALAVAGTGSTGSDACVSAGTDGQEAWRSYDHSTGTVTATGCSDGSVLFVQLMRVNAVQRALPAPWIGAPAASPSPGPGGDDDNSGGGGGGDGRGDDGPSGLSGGAIAGIAVGGLVVAGLIAVAAYFVVIAVQEGLEDETEASDSPAVGAEAGRSTPPKDDKEDGGEGGEFDGVTAGAAAPTGGSSLDDATGLVGSPAGGAYGTGNLAKIVPSGSASNEDAGQVHDGVADPSSAAGTGIDEVRMADRVGSAEGGSRRSSQGSTALQPKRVRVSSSAPGHGSPAQADGADVDDVSVQPDGAAARRGGRRASVEGTTAGTRGSTAALDALAA